jgi:hypothetical protein
VDEPKAPSAEQVREHGEIVGKSKAALAAAFRVHGQDATMRSLERYAEIFGNDKAVQQRILQSEDPVQSAMDAVKGYEFFSKYGNDPEAILNAARAEFETEHLPKLREAETKRIMAELSGKNREPRGIGHLQGGSSDMDKDISKANAGKPRPLKAIFNNF